MGRGGGRQIITTTTTWVDFSHICQHFDVSTVAFRLSAQVSVLSSQMVSAHCPVSAQVSCAWISMVSTHYLIYIRKEISRDPKGACKDGDIDNVNKLDPFSDSDDYI